MTEVEFDPSGERTTSTTSRRALREAEQLRRAAASKPLTRRELREQQRREAESVYTSSADAPAQPATPESAAAAPAEKRVLSRRDSRLAAAASVQAPVRDEARVREAAPTVIREEAAASSTRTSWSLSEEAERAEEALLGPNSNEQQETAAEEARPVPAPVPDETDAARPVLSANSLFAFDEVEVAETLTQPVSRAIPRRPDVKPEQCAAAPAAANTAETRPTPVVVDQGDTQPQPRLETNAKPAEKKADPEQILRTRATTLRGKRTSSAPAPAATHPPTKSRRKRGAVAVRKLAAGGILLVASAFVVATSVPAQAFFGGGSEASTSGEAGGVDDFNAQSVSVPESASQLELMIDGDVGIQDALESARLSPEEVDRIQGIADASTSMPSGWSQGVDGYEEALPLLETSYVQTPFPNIPDAPISSGFEWRWGKVHEAVDFTPGAGTEIYPMANGIVTNVMPGTTSGGHMVTVDHMIDGKRYQTSYAHMIAGSIQVREGQVITIDTVIGQVGSTGFSTGPHLHFGLMRDDVIAIDPIRWWENRSEFTASDAGGSSY
ncbi:M23 family metallopeptidase [uncultured Agrococcus sp.]|uniref:M23 family metallopeptidase n=1 Tax=uncultured Agrococcus sp. TaxID=382258 RepID=UPI0025F4C972|nr:M23 family metallopeptidase [uncultured Agrococcus sp.]